MALLAAIAMPVHAELPTARQLLETQSQTAYVKAQIDLARARNELAAAQSTGRPAPSGMPQITAIERFGKDVVARLRLSDGSPVEVRVNDKLADGSVVSEIRANGVRLLRKGGGATELSFVSGDAPAGGIGAGYQSLAGGSAR
jgi:hypothetical protein